MKQWMVGDVMTRSVASVSLETSYRDAVDTLTHRQVSAVPVVDADRRVLGVVSEADLLHKIEAHDARGPGRIARPSRRATAKAHAATAAQLMTTPAITI